MIYKTLFHKYFELFDDYSYLNQYKISTQNIISEDMQQFLSTILNTPLSLECLGNQKSCSLNKFLKLIYNLIFEIQFINLSIY